MVGSVVVGMPLRVRCDFFVEQSDILARMYDWRYIFDRGAHEAEDG